ncbi:MAG: TRAP transporter small permease subunit [Burkholderiaceae bacterium]
MMRPILAFSDFLEKICTLFARAGAWLILPLILTIVYDVVTRKFIFIQQFVMNSWLYQYISPTKLQEMEWHLHAVIFLLAYGLAYFVGAHVRVDIWREKRGERTRGWVELIAILLLAMPFCAVLIYHSWLFTAKAFLNGEGSPSMTGLPSRWVIKSFLFFGTTLLFASLLSTMLRLLVYLFGPKAIRPQALARLGMVALPAAPSNTDPARHDESPRGAA